MMMSFREKEGSSSYNRNKDNEQQEEEDESNKNNNNNNQSGVGRGRGRASSSSNNNNNNNNNNSSRQWSSAGLKNPRIVRVSRSFGGKDRHSKVCTIKGLRDRRIRLSVPTAIQLYDLQDRLGLSQPSKVIDWLLDTTKHDIDKLPPLPIIPNSSFSQGFGLPFASSSTPFFFDNASLFPPRKDLDAGAGGSGSGSGAGAGAGAGGNININSSSTSTRDHMDANMDEDEEESLVAKLRYWGSTNNAMMRSKHRGVEDHINQDQNQGGNSQVLAQNLFPIASHNTNSANNVLHPHPTTFLSNNNNPMFNYYHLEPSNLSLTQLGNLGLSSSSSSHNDNPHQGSSSHHHHHSNSATQPPSSLSLSSMSQLFLCPSMATTSFFPQQQNQASFMSSSSHHHPQVENDLRNQFSRFPISNNPFSSNFHNSSGLDSKPFPLSMNHEPQLQQGEEDRNRQGKSGSGYTLWKEP